MVIAACTVTAAPSAFAGGPLITQNREPTLWARGLIRGGPLGSATVDASGRVLYRVDSGTLGTLTDAQATAFVDGLFKPYTDIPTADIAFVDAGRIRDPATRQPVDVNGSNFGKFLGLTPTFQNPIIFDSNGAITREMGLDPLLTLGFAGPNVIHPASNTVRDGLAVLNGAALTGPGAFSLRAFLGAFAHEFGHFAGPLDHSQINAHFADTFFSNAVPPPGFTRAQAYDLFAPFGETMYPFEFFAPVGSQLAAQFPFAGDFITTLDMDTQNALSALYPTPGFVKNFGSIEGRVVIRTQTGDIPVSGINVVARRIDQGVYPPLVGTQAFTSPPMLDADGAPEPPQPQAATDPLATASSGVSGLILGEGRYRIQGVPQGEYLLEVQQSVASIGPLEKPFPLPVEEFYSGPRESGDLSDQPSDFEGIRVAAGQPTTGIDIALNGFSDVGVAPVTELELNHIKPQPITIPSDIMGAAVATGPSLLEINFGVGLKDKIEDLYRFTLSEPTRVYITLEPILGRGGFFGAGDLDLYLFTSAVNKRMSSLGDPNLLDTSFSGRVEMVGPAFILQPGTYLIGVSAFEGSASYHLHVFSEQAGLVASE